MQIRTYSIVFTLLISLSACNGSGSGSSNGIQINSVSGTIDYSNLVYDQSCYNFGGNDYGVKSTLTGNTLVQSNYNYSSSDASCSTGETLDFSETYSISVEGNSQASWDGSTPTRNDGNGSLNSTVTATKFSSTITAITPGTTTPVDSIGDVNKTVMYVDDTGLFPRKYTGSISGGTTTDGYPLLLNPYSF